MPILNRKQRVSDEIPTASMADIAFLLLVAAGFLGGQAQAGAFVGGGALALADQIRDWFPNQAIAEHPAFANARGMLKYLRYVCETPHG